MRGCPACPEYLNAEKPFGGLGSTRIQLAVVEGSSPLPKAPFYKYD